MYGNRNPPEDPPCERCKVDLLPENNEAFRIYMLTKSQYIMGFNGPIDINHMAVWEAIDRYKVDKPTEVFERVTRCAKTIIYEMMEKTKPVET